MSWMENVRIETPEQIDVDLELAGPGSRFCAQCLDWLIKFGVLAVTFLCVALAGAAAGMTFSQVPAGIGYAVLALVAVAVFVFFFGYDVWFEGCRNGQTPGKRLTGIRVVRDGGGPIDVQAALIRNLVGLADFLPLGYLLGGFLAMVSARGQRLGDMAAGTVVIRERPMDLALDLEATILARAGPEFFFTAPHLDRCTANDRHVLHSFFARCDQMGDHARHELAKRLRDTFLERTGFEPALVGAPAATEPFLAALYRDLKQRREQG